jgi:hypothetical protein
VRARVPRKYRDSARRVGRVTTALSLTFHRRLLRLLSGRAIIESVNPIAPASASIITAAALALLVAACGGSAGTHVAQLGSTTTQRTRTPSSNPATTSSQSTNPQRMLAFSRCVRAHGVPNYPDPESSGHLPVSGKQIAHDSPQFPAAESACAHLLSSGAGTLQQRQQKLAFAVKVARCIRRHGFPAFPDPTATGQALPPGLDTNSPQFQATVTACEKHTRGAP